MKFFTNPYFLFSQKKSIYKCFLSFVFLSLYINGLAQYSGNFHRLLEPADSINKARIYGLVGGGVLSYGTTCYFLYNDWYRDYPTSRFHLYNDLHQWEYMDKAGHLFTTWSQAYFVNEMMRWTGVNDKKSITAGMISAMVFQSTIELMDGLSAEWGFSVPDLAANTLGAGLFGVQEYLYGEQKLILKFSYYPQAYAGLQIPAEVNTMTTISDRANELFGSSMLQRVLKDYNAQTYWLSFHPNFFSDYSILPDWLNISIGYSAGNLYGGVVNSWDEDGSQIDISGQYPRYHQFFIAPDINWNKISPDSVLLRALFHLINVFKLPSPALEINDKGGVQLVFHWIYF